MQVVIRNNIYCKNNKLLINQSYIDKLKTNVYNGII